MSFFFNKRFRSSILLGLITCSAPIQWADPLPNPDAESDLIRVVEVQPSKAKDVPAMRITLSPDPLHRTETGYESIYQVTVFPFFFFNETGNIQIDVEPETLEMLEEGEVISFIGRAVNHRGQERRVEGRAYPADTLSGKIKLVVFVGGIELIFNTTYRFTGQRPSETAE